MTTRAAPKLAVLGLIGVATLVSVGCGRVPSSTRDVGPDGAGEMHVVEVIARDDAFEPAVVSVTLGAHVTIDVTNADDTPHDLVVFQPPLRTRTLQPRERASVTVPVGNDPVTFYCSLHPGMTGQIRGAMLATG